MNIFDIAHQCAEQWHSHGFEFFTYSIFNLPCECLSWKLTYDNNRSVSFLFRKKMAPLCATRVFVVLVFVASCVQFGKAVSCGTTNDITKDTTFVMRKCNSNIRNYYDRNAGEDWRTTYCRGMIVSSSLTSSQHSL